jgi:hypothetical protein
VRGRNKERNKREGLSSWKTVVSIVMAIGKDGIWRKL